MSDINEIFISESDFRSRYQYNEKDLLGEGGFAQVFKAYDKQFQEYVALKFYSKGDQGKYDVLHEMKDTRRYSHPNIIRIHDALVVRFEHTGGHSYVQVGILEYANGGNLRDFIQSQPTEKSFAQVLIGILKGLEYLHEDKKLIHRDLSPENVLMHHEGDIWIPKIADFGISKRMDITPDAKNQNKSTQLLGKVDYMAPEQFYPEKYGIARRISTNVDLWAFGVILYELFQQKLPFGQKNEDSPLSIIQSIVSDQPSHLDQIPEPYRTIINRCLEKKAAVRVQHATEIISLLQGWLQKHSGTQKMQTGRIRTMEITMLEKNKKAYLKPLTAGIVVIVLGVAAYFFISVSKPDPPSPQPVNQPNIAFYVHKFDSLMAIPKFIDLINIYLTLPDTFKTNKVLQDKYFLSKKILKTDSLMAIANGFFIQKNYDSAIRRYQRIDPVSINDRKFLQNRIDTIKVLLNQNPAKPKLFVAGNYPRNKLNIKSSTNKALTFESLELTSSATIITLKVKAGESIYFSSPGNSGSFYIISKKGKLPLRDISGIKTGSFIVEETDKTFRLFFAKLASIESFNLIQGDNQFHQDYHTADFIGISLK